MLWADPTDQAVIAAVTGLDVTNPVPDDGSVRTALSIASEILTLATAHLIHPAGSQVEEFICTRNVRRFSPVYGPITQVVSVSQLDRAGTETPLEQAWQLVGNTIYFFGPSRGLSHFRHIADCAPDQGVFRVHYRFGSTLSRAARASVLEYARELWLAAQDPGECSLPDRVTSLQREGISIEMFDPADYLDKGKIGLPRVDTWLSQANPKQARRPSGVYTPDSPPGVGTRLQRI